MDKNLTNSLLYTSSNKKKCSIFHERKCKSSRKENLLCKKCNKSISKKCKSANIITKNQSFITDYFKTSKVVNKHSKDERGILNTENLAGVPKNFNKDLSKLCNVKEFPNQFSSPCEAKAHSTKADFYANFFNKIFGDDFNNSDQSLSCSQKQDQSHIVNEPDVPIIDLIFPDNSNFTESFEENQDLTLNCSQQENHIVNEPHVSKINLHFPDDNNLTKSFGEDKKNISLTCSEKENHVVNEPNVPIIDLLFPDDNNLIKSFEEDVENITQPCSQKENINVNEPNIPIIDLLFPDDSNLSESFKEDKENATLLCSQGGNPIDNKPNGDIDLLFPDDDNLTKSFGENEETLTLLCSQKENHIDNKPNVPIIDLIFPDDNNLTKSFDKDGKNITLPCSGKENHIVNEPNIPIIDLLFPDDSNLSESLKEDKENVTLLCSQGGNQIDNKPNVPIIDLLFPDDINLSESFKEDKENILSCSQEENYIHKTNKPNVPIIDLIYPDDSDLTECFNEDKENVTLSRSHGQNNNVNESDVAIIDLIFPDDNTLIESFGKDNENLTLTCSVEQNDIVNEPDVAIIDLIYPEDTNATESFKEDKDNITLLNSQEKNHIVNEPGVAIIDLIFPDDNKLSKSLKENTKNNTTGILENIVVTPDLYNLRKHNSQNNQLNLTNISQRNLLNNEFDINSDTNCFSGRENNSQVNVDNEKSELNIEDFLNTPDQIPNSKEKVDQDKYVYNSDSLFTQSERNYEKNDSNSMDLFNSQEIHNSQNVISGKSDKRILYSSEDLLNFIYPDEHFDIAEKNCDRQQFSENLGNANSNIKNLSEEIIETSEQQEIEKQNVLQLFNTLMNDLIFDKNTDNTKEENKKYPVCQVKRYSNGKTKIFRFKYSKTPKPKQNSREDDQYEMENLLKNLSQQFENYDNYQSRGPLSEIVFERPSTPSSYITDDGSSESSIEEFLPQQQLRANIKRAIKNCQLERRKFPIIINNLDEEKENIKLKIQELLLDITEDTRKLKPIMYRSQNTKNLIFKDERIQYKPNEDCLFTKVCFYNQSTHLKYCLMVVILYKVKQLLESNTKLTKREIYYELKSYINDQRSTDSIINSITCLLDCGPWALNIVAQKGLVYGNLNIVLLSGDTINCNVPGTLVPRDLDDILEIKTDAHFILVVEKESVFQKLIEDDLISKFDRSVIMITGKGFADLNTQLFIRKLSSIISLPVFILTDADPHGIRIMLNYKYGSLKNAHISQHLALPQAKWLGVYPSEIIKLDAERQMLTQNDMNIIKHILASPCVENNERIVKELNILQENKFKAEIEGFFKTDHFFSDLYLPKKLFNQDFV